MARMLTKSAMLAALSAWLIFARPQVAAPPATSSSEKWAGIAVLPDGIETDNRKRDDAWWLDAMDRGGAEFWKSLQVDNVQAETKRYVDEFGSHGAAFDFAWGLVDPEVVLVAESGSSPLTEKGTPEPSAHVRHEFFRAMEVSLAEAQVRRFIADPKLLDRYCKFVFFSRLLFGANRDDDTFRYMANRIRHGFEEDKPDAFFWYAREFMVLAYVTDRTDLLLDAKPENLGKRFNKWLGWLTDIQTPAIDHMRADPDRFIWKFEAGYHNGHVLPPLTIPPHPFDDWSGSAPENIGKLSKSYGSLLRVRDARRDADTRLEQLESPPKKDRPKGP